MCRILKTMLLTKQKKKQYLRFTTLVDSFPPVIIFPRRGRTGMHTDRQERDQRAEACHTLWCVWMISREDWTLLAVLKTSRRLESLQTDNVWGARSGWVNDLISRSFIGVIFDLHKDTFYILFIHQAMNSTFISLRHDLCFNLSHNENNKCYKML